MMSALNYEASAYFLGWDGMSRISAEEERLWSIVRANSLDFDEWTALIEETEKAAEHLGRSSGFHVASTYRLCTKGLRHQLINSFVVSTVLCNMFIYIYIEK